MGVGRAHSVSVDAHVDHHPRCHTQRSTTVAVGSTRTQALSLGRGKTLADRHGKTITLCFRTGRGRSERIKGDHGAEITGERCAVRMRSL